MTFEELKQSQSVMWGSGDYQAISETMRDVDALVVERLDLRPGDRWLDVACGTGAVAELAARAGATVTGIDIAPVLIENREAASGCSGARDRLPRRRLRAAGA
ncbi:MAG: class I SAM-dependent methyltransferase [Egibacteraceae bacterium]